MLGAPQRSQFRDLIGHENPLGTLLNFTYFARDWLPTAFQNVFTALSFRHWQNRGQRILANKDLESITGNVATVVQKPEP